MSYSDKSILLINTLNNHPILLDSRLLALYNIKGIEAVFLDDFGNIIIKNFSKIYIANLYTGKLKQIYKNLKLEKSIILVRNNIIYIAGNFGVVTSDITGPATIANTSFYQNTKNIFYNYVTDAQFSNSSAFLKTDNGNYTVNFTRGYSEGKGIKYRVVANYADALHNLSPGDSITLSPDINTFAIDIINPTGTGQLNIEYAINGNGYNNTGHQLILPPLQPGSYNIVSIIASDDSWRSKPLNFTIYIQPKWWQTQTAMKVIFVLSLLTFIGFVYLVIVMTRRIVNRSNERRNQRRELELKSIYSQINPHFIFNSLSTAQYFVKKNKNKEAFEHINQFSDLLRSYIKSSRAKYITIAEEIENLENYLQLQLTRFEEKFDYTIEVDKLVDAGKVKIPSLLLQPLVENALNHGIFHSDKKGRLNISFSIDGQDKGTLVCIVDDDGIGRQKAKELRGEMIRRADSYGTILIKE
ncbi:MAG: histidine kinase, partial [Taibaiella sp.]|nr:histidine kinase [Taibaiella sp.]